MTDDFTTAARAEARRESPLYDNEVLSYGVRMAEWARDHLTAQEPTDAECIHVLSVLGTDLGQPTRTDFEWSQAAIRRCRAALIDAKEARGHEHAWRQKQNVTTKGYVMPAYEACTCGAAKEARHG